MVRLSAAQGKNAYLDEVGGRHKVRYRYLENVGLNSWRTRFGDMPARPTVNTKHAGAGAKPNLARDEESSGVSVPT